MAAQEYTDAIKKYYYLLEQEEIKPLQDYEIDEKDLLKAKIDDYEKYR